MYPWRHSVVRWEGCRAAQVVRGGTRGLFGVLPAATRWWLWRRGGEGWVWAQVWWVDGWVGEDNRVDAGDQH